MVASSDTLDVRQTILDAAQRIMGGKGFSAVGLNEILTAADVPKGSFYYYFASKDAFGAALLESYFKGYLDDLDVTLERSGLTMAERLMVYWAKWRETQGDEGQQKCLAVKLGAEVADLSEPMRLALDRGMSAIIARLAKAIEAGAAEGSLSVDGASANEAATLYHLWLGASLMAKILKTAAPFETATATTRRILHLS